MNRIKVNIPIGTSGKWSIRKATGDSNTIYNNILGSPCGGKIEPYDDYTFLFHDDIKFVMSDTYSEYAEHQPLWNNMTGDVLIGGLGLGLVNHKLIQDPNITSVTIIEKNQDVIDLVWDHCPKDNRFNLVVADVETWQPSGIWDCAWFDTWTGENPLNEQEYAQLIQQKYGNICNWLGIWQSIWT
jgi:hypothetical protein